jgi:uncharacterized protein DUF695
MQKDEDDWRLTEWCASDSSEVRYFRKNLAPRVSPRDPGYPWLFYLSFHYQPKDETGLPAADDSTILGDIEEKEIFALEEKNVAVLVGTVLKAGVKDLLFYGRDPKAFLSKAEPIRARYPEYGVEWEIIHDPTWEQYADFP